MKKKTKAQIAGQAFIFILAAAIAVLIIVYGYNAIQSFLTRTEQISLVNFRSDLKSEIRTIASDYGSVKKLELQMPGQFQMLCLTDIGYANKQSTCLCNRGACPAGREQEFQPVVCDAWTTEGNENNAFLVSDAGAEPIEVSDIQIQGGEGYACIPSRGTKVTLRLEGRGSYTLVSEWPVDKG